MILQYSQHNIKLPVPLWARVRFMCLQYDGPVSVLADSTEWTRYCTLLCLNLAFASNAVSLAQGAGAGHGKEGTGALLAAERASWCNHDDSQRRQPSAQHVRRLRQVMFAECASSPFGANVSSIPPALAHCMVCVAPHAVVNGPHRGCRSPGQQVPV